MRIALKIYKCSVSFTAFAIVVQKILSVENDALMHLLIQSFNKIREMLRILFE